MSTTTVPEFCPKPVLEYLTWKCLNDATLECMFHKDEALAKATVEEYQRFLYMLYLQDRSQSGKETAVSDIPSTPLSPSELVDMVWHTHILHTRVYVHMCTKYFTHFIHHVPEWGEEAPESEKEIAAKQGRYQAMLQFYQRVFNEPAPAHIWGGVHTAEAGTCSSCQPGKCSSATETAITTGTCSNCSPGKCNSKLGSCSSCQPGKCSSKLGTCSSCQPGKCTSKLGSCSSCQPGKCSSKLGSCSSCQPGKCSSKLGSCSSCQPGKCTSKLGTCSNCSPGKCQAVLAVAATN